MIMKTNLISALLMGMTLSACVVSQDAIVPSENYITQKVKVEAFGGISTSTAIDVVYTQADQTDIEIYAPDNLMPFVKLVNDGGMLKVFFESDEPGNGINIRGKHHTKVNISAPAVHALHTSSSGDIVLVNGMKTNGLVTVESSSAGEIEGSGISCEELVIEASSAGDIELKNVACNTLQVEASSAGDVSLSGTCRIAKLEASSAGEIDADDLKADTVKAEASSSGDVSCYAVESLEATTSSAGNVYFKGNPKQIRNHSKGVKKID
jgi:predicted RecA/RadA family phage recombinase